ncbi:MAG TPA: cytochrome c [Bdellovibrionales bacterium]|nr:cytochrome c [Bdellovibrionales bacterium]
MQNDSYNRGGYIAFLFSMVFSLAFFLYIAVIHKGVNLKEIPEVATGDQTLAEGAPAAVDVSQIAKPWEDNPDMVEHGKKSFAANCAVCHGDTGMGDGAAGKALNPPPRDLVAGKWTHGGGSADLFTTIEKGIAGTSMASFAHLPATDRWALVQFIHSITKNRPKDDPAKLEAFAKTAK